MRIALLADAYPPRVGGLEQHVQTLGRELARRGHDVRVMTIAAPTDPPLADDDGIGVVRIPSLVGRVPGAYEEVDRPFAPPAPDPGLVLGLGRALRALRPDVVHAHGWIAHAYPPLKPAIGAPLVVTLHDYGSVCARRDLIYRGGDCSGPGLAKCLGCAAEHYGPVRGTPIVLGEFTSGPVVRAVTDATIAVSRAVVTGNRLEGDDVTVIPNFLRDDAIADPTNDAATAAAIAPFLERLPPGPFLLDVGALGGHKGLPTMLEAYERLASALPLVLIGHRWVDTPTTMPAGVMVHEDWPNAAVRAAWRRATVGVIPSTWGEPCPTVAFEAMAAGCPIVVSDAGGLPDIVDDGRTGLVVPRRDAVALAGAIQRLLDDEPLRVRIASAARVAANAYRASVVVPRIEAVYEIVATGRRRSTARRSTARRVTPPREAAGSR